MDLFFAHPGDLVLSKIDLKNGAVTIIPGDWINVVVTNHFAVYELDRSRILPDYFLRIIQAEFFTKHLWYNKVGAEGRKEVKLDFFESIQIPLPSLDIQRILVSEWQQAKTEITEAEASLEKVKHQLNTTLYLHYNASSQVDVLGSRSFSITWESLSSWDTKTARASMFHLANPSFKSFGYFAEEATELVRPYEEPDKEWPVYGVNNKEGVFFSHYQKGKDFNAAYKRIHKDWFFHNPTRSSVGSLGIVPDVPEDALTSPEYQVRRLKDDAAVPGYVAVVIATEFFIRLIQFHRVGAVKQRLYVENLLQIPIPVLSKEEQESIAKAREDALTRISNAKHNLLIAKEEIEAMILGAKPVPSELIERAERGDRNKFREAMAKVADVEPDEQDRL